MTSRTHNAAAVGAITLLWAISTAPTAWAAPANPKPDTPNTSSWISTTSVEQCNTLDFEAHGFPKGQTLNIALDDDDQNAEKQPIDDTGSASGTIEIPCDFPTGTHRLHFTSTDDYTSYSPNFEVTAKPAATSEAADKPGATPSRDSAHLANGNGRTSNNAEPGAGSNNSNRGTSQSRSGAATTTETASHNKVKATGFTAQPTTIPNNGGLFDKNADEAAPTPTSTVGSIPYVGFFVGGAILLVGMTAINAWLYVQRNDSRRDRDRDRGRDRRDSDRDRRDPWDDEPVR